MFGGQILAQTIVAVSTVDRDKVLKSVHTIFARGADRDQPLDLEVEAMHVGRALASVGRSPPGRAIGGAPGRSPFSARQSPT